jgi:hypothetical protein
MAEQGVFGVSGGGMFDDVNHTQGGMPHLLQYLWDAYCAYLDGLIEKRRARGARTVKGLEEAKRAAPATHFVEWAAAHLKENRVVENFFIDANHGVRLANNACLAVCPGTEVRGSMQDSGAVAVTEGRSQPGNEGVTPTSVMRI